MWLIARTPSAPRDGLAALSLAAAVLEHQLPRTVADIAQGSDPLVSVCPCVELIAAGFAIWSSGPEPMDAAPWVTPIPSARPVRAARVRRAPHRPLPPIAHPPLLDHPIWADLRPYVHMTQIGTGVDGRTPRPRIDVQRLPLDLLLRVIAVEVPCCACGRLTHPIRRRAGPVLRRDEDPERATSQGLYYAATCPLDISSRCSKGRAATADYDAMAREMGYSPDSFDTGAGPDPEADS